MEHDGREDDTMGDPKPLLFYASREQRPRLALWKPILLALLQFIWLVTFLISSLFWEGPKRVLHDSLIVLIATLPSFITLLIGFRYWRHYRSQPGRDGTVIIASLICVTSAIVLGWMGWHWVMDIILDPHGTWSR